MSWLGAPFYDWFMADSERECLSEWRATLLQQAEGEVIEIGAGTGANLGFYSEEVTRLVLAEPDSGMRSQLVAKLDRPGEVIDAPAEALPYPDCSFDVAVATLVLCTVSDHAGAVAELHRVLRPGGKLLFLEHVAAANGTSRRTWQGRIEPVWKRLAGGCCLTRETEAAIRTAGFEVVDCKAESMRKAMPIVRPTIRGVARKSQGTAE